MQMDRRGKIQEYSKSSAGFVALLYNFDIGVAAVKPDHMQWLRESLKPFSRSSTVKTTVLGFASRTGADQFNQSLSTLRAFTTQQVIARMGGPPAGPNPYPARMSFGENAARLTGDPDAYESERWRSVLVIVSEPGKPPDLPKPVFIQPKVRRLMVTFTIEATVGGAFSGGGEPGDRAAQNSARLAGQLWGVGNTNEYFGLVPGNATLSEIRAKPINQTVGLSNVGMPGVLDTTIRQAQVEFVYTVGGRSRPTYNGKILDTDDLAEWMDNPSKKYLEYGPIRLN